MLFTRNNEATLRINDVSRTGLTLEECGVFLQKWKIPVIQKEECSRGLSAAGHYSRGLLMCPWETGIITEKI